MNPRFSIVVPAFNAAATIERCVTAALAHPGAEIIVVDDGSTDGTPELARRIAPAASVHVQPNAGANAARNRGLALARGAHVLFLDADDWREPWREAFAPAADVTIGPLEYRFASGRRLVRNPAEVLPDPGPAALLNAWLRGRFFPPVAVLWRTEFLRSVGGWNEAIRVNQDGELMFRALLRQPTVAVAADMGTGFYVQHPGPRVSTRKFPGRDREFLDIFLALEAAARDGGQLEAIRQSLAGAIYGRARAALSVGEIAVGTEALARARALGLRGHRGDTLHKVVATLIGLRGKEALARWVRRLPGPAGEF